MLLGDYLWKFALFIRRFKNTDFMDWEDSIVGFYCYLIVRENDRIEMYWLLISEFWRFKDIQNGFYFGIILWVEIGFVWRYEEFEY